jgi:hypothetical protein
LGNRLTCRSSVHLCFIRHSVLDLIVQEERWAKKYGFLSFGLLSVSSASMFQHGDVLLYGKHE